MRGGSGNELVSALCGPGCCEREPPLRGQGEDFTADSGQPQILFLIADFVKRERDWVPGRSGNELVSALCGPGCCERGPPLRGA